MHDVFFAFNRINYTRWELNSVFSPTLQNLIIPTIWYMHMMNTAI